MRKPIKKVVELGELHVKDIPSLAAARAAQDSVRVALEDSLASRLPNPGSTMPSLNSMFNDAQTSAILRALSDATVSTISISQLAAEAQADLLANSARASTSINELAEELQSLHDALTAATSAVPSVGDLVDEAQLKAIADLSAQVAAASATAVWLTPQDEITSFADQVRDRLNMSVSDFIRDLDSGRWDDVIDDPDHRDVLYLALLADVVRDSVG